MIAAIKNKLLRIFSLIAVVAALSFTIAPEAAAQNSDSWKSAAIVGGSALAGAIVGGKLAGSRGALIGGAAGATTGYAIDRHRRQNEYDHYYGDNGDNGYYRSNGSYDGNNGGNDGYYGPADRGNCGRGNNNGSYDRYGNYYPDDSYYGRRQR